MSASNIDKAVEWNWYTQGPFEALQWHWSPKHNWKMSLPIAGWSEGLIAYVLAAGAARHPISANVSHEGWARNGALRIARTHPGAVIVALHPGTVATELSKTFTHGHQIMTPDVAAEKLLAVIDSLEPAQTGRSSPMTVVP